MKRSNSGRGALLSSSSFLSSSREDGYREPKTGPVAGIPVDPDQPSADEHLPAGVPREARREAAQHQGPVPGRPNVSTVAACVRRFCLDCLGATSGRAAFDCGSEVCPLRPSSPFLGKPMPRSMRTEDYDGEPARVAKRRPSRSLIHAQCRQCQPGDRTDCEAEGCALYPYRPWDGPGKVPRRKLSDKRLAQIAAARNRSPLAQPSGRREQKPSTVVGAALNA